jgi:hypothetical protein
MSRPHARVRGSFAQDTLTAEFTTGQIVIMACAALAVACVMFALGVLVGKYDPSQRVEVATAAENTTAPVAAQEGTAAPAAPAPLVVAKAEPVPAPTVSESSAPSPQPAQPVEPVAAVAAAEEVKALEESAPAEEVKETVVASATPATGTLSESVKPRVTRVEPLPLTTGATPRVTRVEPLPESLPAAQAKPAEANPAAAKPAAKTPINELDEGAELMEPLAVPGKVAQAKPESKPAAKKPEAAAPVSTKVTGKFAIQIASFKGSAGKAKAEDYARRVSQTTGRAAQVSTAGDVYRVVISGFSDKAAATEACNKLKQNAEFKDAFVKTL